MNSSFLKYSLFIILLSSWYINLNAQELIFESNIYSENKRSGYSDLFPFYNSENEETALFLENELAKSLDLLLLDNQGKEQPILKGRTPKLRISNFVGTMYNEGIYTAYYVDKGNFMLGTTSFNTIEKTTSSKTMHLNLIRGEKNITQFQYKNLFYFVTLQKETSIVNFHIYSNNTYIEKKSIELNNSDFPHFLRDNLFNCLAYNNGKFKSIDLLNPLYSDQNSDYFIQQDSVFYMVVNTHKVVKINLETLKSRVIDFPINYAEANESYKKSVFKNIIKKTKSKSTIYNDIFFRVSVVKQTIRLQAYDINNGDELLNTIIDNNQLKAKTIYDTKFQRNINFVKREELLINALNNGNFGFRVFKEGDNYKIHLGKVATEDFWDVFDNSLNQENNKRSSQLGFTNKFVGVFSDYKGNEPNSYLLSPLFEKENIQSRYLEFTFNKAQGILPVMDTDKIAAVNKFTQFRDAIQNKVYQYKLNGLFRRGKLLNFVTYNPSNSTISLYEF